MVFKKYFFAGLLVWLPIWATFVVVRLLVEVLDGTLSLLPRAYRPENILGFYIPGLGLIIAITIIVITGMFATNFLGKRLVSLWESLLAHIPFVRSIYNSVKQVVHTVLTSSNDSFRQVLLIEYPRSGLWSIAFQTSETSSIITEITQQKMLTVFVPTTPNPTSGFIIMVPEQDAIKLNMSVDAALKMVISLGVVQPSKAQQDNVKSHKIR